MSDDTSESPELNPYRPPETSSRVAKVLSKVPGWLVLFFGVVGLLLWGIGEPGPGSVNPDIDAGVNTINALLYGLPGAIAAIVFGLGNLRAGKGVVPSFLGVLLGLGSLAIGAWKIYQLVSP